MAPAVAVALALLVGACATPATERAHEARFVLLGEVHDNAAQHLERAALLRRLLADGRPTRVVFEQMRSGREAAIAAAGRDAEAVADAGGLDRAAWGWPLHRPLLQAALDGGATVVGGNLDPGTVRAVARGGAAPPALHDALEADGGWTPAHESTLRAAIDAGHCGALPASTLAPMARAQRVRDLALARAMLDAPAGTRAVLVAGNVHVRSDIGVPHHLRAAGVMAADILSIGFVEPGDTTSAFDAVRVTPPAPRPDPCAALRR